MALPSYVEEYLMKGYCPLPIPTNAKFPPPRDTTGSDNYNTQEKIIDLWDREVDAADLNVGLRLQTHEDSEYDIIALDVDTYGAKSGWDTLNSLSEQLGPIDFNSVPFSTRRRLSDNSGQYLFKVPKGSVLSGKAGDGIDIIQFRHRYTVAYPSSVDGAVYRWYLNGVETSIPEVDSLPHLPQAWVSALKSTGKSRNSKVSPEIFDRGRSDTDNYRAAADYMRKKFYGWDFSGDGSAPIEEWLSASIAKDFDPADLRERYRSNSHDPMVTDVYKLVRLGAEGHLGIKVGLHRIREAQIAVHKERGNQGRPELELKREFARAVSQAVAKLDADVQAGEATILQLPEFNLPQDWMERRRERMEVVKPKGFNFDELPDRSDYSYAQAFWEYWDGAVKHLEGSGGKEFVIWNRNDRRYEHRTRADMYHLFQVALPDRLLWEARQLEIKSGLMQEAMSQEQIEEPDQTPEDIQDLVATYKAEATRLGSTKTKNDILAQVGSIPNASIPLSRLDSVRGVLGGGPGQAIDLEEFVKGNPAVREATRRDLLSMSTHTEVVEGATSLAWEGFLDRHLPEPKMRDFVQKVLGYSLEWGNPEKLLPVLWGPSNTGKSAILEACKNALGDYGSASTAGTLLNAPQSGANPALVGVVAKRMVTLAEVGSSEKLNADALKRITGSDEISARRLYSSIMVTRIPQFTPYMSTNTVPEIAGADLASKNRIVLLPFDHSHPARRVEPDEDLHNDKNAQAILWWLIEGYKKYREEGLDPSTWPEESRRGREDFSSEWDELSGFIKDRTVPDPSGCVSANEMWKAWTTWTVNEGMTPGGGKTKRGFAKEMRAYGYGQQRKQLDGERTQVFTGLKMK